MWHKATRWHLFLGDLPTGTESGSAVDTLTKLDTGKRAVQLVFSCVVRCLWYNWSLCTINRIMFTFIEIMLETLRFCWVNSWWHTFRAVQWKHSYCSIVVKYCENACIVAKLYIQGLLNFSSWTQAKKLIASTCYCQLTFILHLEPVKHKFCELQPLISKV